MKKTALQLDREIAEALAEAKFRPPSAADKVDILRVRFSQALGSLAQRRGGLAVFYALKQRPRGYAFESSDSGEIRALWHALTRIYREPPDGGGGRALGQAAGKKLAELRPIIAASWPEALAE